MQKFIRYALPALLWMGLIFLFSHHPKHETEKYSKLVIAFLQFLHIDLNEMTMGGGTFLVRKLAHVTEYFILFLFVSRAQKHYFPTLSSLYLMLFCLLYAASDEYHQTFIFGRVGCLSDVGVDMLGVILGWQIRKKSLFL
ncbi:MAG: VanZ family protein [Bacteroidia bacterium]